MVGVESRVEKPMEVEWLAMRMVGQRLSSWQKQVRLAAKRLADPVAEEKAVGVVAEVMVVVGTVMEVVAVEQVIVDKSLTSPSGIVPASASA